MCGNMCPWKYNKKRMSTVNTATKFPFNILLLKLSRLGHLAFRTRTPRFRKIIPKTNL